ncbi:MAG: AAA family ATPase [Anaerovibrio sp.]|uniref:AAA family ATPase n=1 Tax=Anaerovibrio sp. TaxID=1872532 RepID=UPI0025FFCBAA|nr:AAA family ATPase [Anaerovibrio sp.]MCR5177191.1 AAA family ATPase [Anaerovibrio sp.]
MIDLLIRGLSIHWDKISRESYLRKIPTVNSITHIDFTNAVTIFTGENGTGKSTLLEAMAIAAGFNPEGGTRNYSFSTYDDYSELCNAITLVKGFRPIKWGYFLRAESFYNVATAEEIYGRHSLKGAEEYHKQSHGESFISLVQKNFKVGGLYFMDEPEAALSPQRQLGLLAEIDKCARTGAQFFIVTHSPILLGIPDAELISFDGGRLHGCKYEDTASYRITKLFMEERERVLYELRRQE